MLPVGLLARLLLARLLLALLFPLTALALALAFKLFELFTQPLSAAESRFEIVSTGLVAVKGVLRLTHLVAQLVQALRDCRLTSQSIRGIALPQDFDAPSHLHTQILLLGIRQGIAEFAGCGWLGSGRVAGRFLNVFLDLREFLDQLLLFGLKRLRLATRDSRLQQARPPLFVLHHIAQRLAHVLLEVALLLRELLGSPREVFHLLAGLLPALTSQHFARFAEPFGCAPGFRLALGRSLVLRGARVLHVARRFCEPLDRTIQSGGLAAGGLPTLLTLLATLALAFAALLPLLTLLRLLSLRRRLAARQLLHLAAQFFGLTPQHLLLPPLLISLLVLLLLISQFLLPARQFFKLGERFFDLLLTLIRRRGILAGFELILLAVQLEIKQAL